MITFSPLSSPLLSPLSLLITGMQDLAMSKIHPNTKLQYYHKQLVDDSDGAHRDSFALRTDLRHMQTAVAEW